MRRRYGQRITEEQRLRSLVRRRRAMTDANARRRAERFGTVCGEIKREEVLERDSHLCYLCGK